MKSVKNITFTICYLIISIIIIRFTFISTINETNEYMDDVYARMNLTIRDTGAFNAHNAREIQDIIDAGEIHQLRETKVSNVEMRYYPSRDEYGFNQGVFPETTPKGTLMGKGKAPKLTLDNLGHFLVLDRMWAFYDQRSIFNNHFFVNFKTDYVYLSHRLDNSSNMPLYAESFIDNRFLTSDIDNIGRQKEKYGYFFTRPYLNIYSGERVVSVLSPIIENGILIADLGIHIELSKLASTVSLYPKIKNKVNLYIDFSYDDEIFTISEGRFDWWDIYTHTYEIEDLGTFIAVYDISLLLAEKGYLIILLIFLYFLMLTHVQRSTRERNAEDEIKRQLSLDAMTQLYNRRGLDELLSTDIEEYRAQSKLISLISIDADKFKQINDEHGHQMGDKALIFIAKAMRYCGPKESYSIRMGGDEFLMILPNHDLEQAKIVGKNISEYLKLFSPTILGVSVEVSIACILLKESETFDQAYIRVDELMYEEKEKGK